MKASTAHNHFRRLLGYLDSIYSEAHITCPTHIELIAEIKEKVWSDPAYSKIPSYYKGDLNGYNRARLTYIQNNLTVWLFPQTTGAALSWDEMSEDMRKTYCCADVKGSFYWIKRIAQRNTRNSARIIETYEVTDKVF